MPAHRAALPPFVRPRRLGRIRDVSLLTAAGTLLYIAAKVHYAIEGRLGIHGGPHVAPEAYADHGNVAAAQWANAGVAMLLLGLVLLPLAPFTRSWPSWTLVVPISLASLAMLTAGVGFLVRAVTGDGGVVAGAYIVLWAVLLGRLAFVVWTRPAEVRHGD
jgi:hypothetical protein